MWTWVVLIHSWRAFYEWRLVGMILEMTFFFANVGNRVLLFIFGQGW